MNKIKTSSEGQIITNNLLNQSIKNDSEQNLSKEDNYWEDDKMNSIN